MQTIIPKITAAGENRKTLLTNNVPQTFQLDGTLAPGEEILFFLVGINGEDNAPWISSGEIVKFTSLDTSPIPVYSPLDLFIEKSATVSPVGLKLVG